MDLSHSSRRRRQRSCRRRSSPFLTALLSLPCSPLPQGIKQYDPRVVDCLLDLTYKAASDILSDAEVRATAVQAAGWERH